MRLPKLTQRLGHLALILSLVVLSGCSSIFNKKVTLYPIQQTDFYVTDSGDVCMSEFYFTEVLQVELENK